MVIVRVSSKNIFHRIRNIKKKGIRNVKERITINEMERIDGILSTVSNIKVICHDDDIVNTGLSILYIL